MLHAKMLLQFEDNKIETKTIEGLFDSEIELKLILKDEIAKTRNKIKNVIVKSMRKVG